MPAIPQPTRPRIIVIGFSRAYIEDQWKATSKLTVNVGAALLADHHDRRDRHLMYNLINLTRLTAVAGRPSTPATATIRRSGTGIPRVGLAYDPFADHKTSIRAGFGMFHNVIYSRDLNYWLQPPFLTATANCGAGRSVSWEPAPTSCSPLQPRSRPGVIPTNGLESIHQLE